MIRQHRFDGRYDHVTGTTGRVDHYSGFAREDAISFSGDRIVIFDPWSEYWSIHFIDMNGLTDWSFESEPLYSIAWTDHPNAIDYDVVRGELAALSASDLGPVTCLGDDVGDAVIIEPAGDGDPAPDTGWFYLFAYDSLSGTRSYGQASDGSERVVLSGDCPN